MNIENLRNKEFEKEIAKHKHFLDQYEKATKETLDEMNKVHGPYWQARNDLARVLITVSAAILALTVTFSSSNLLNRTPEYCIYLILFTWFFLICTIMVCIASLWLTMKISSVHIHFVNQQPIFLKKVEQMLAHGRFEKEFFEGLFSAPFKNVGKNDTWSYRLLLTGLVFFSLSLISLCWVGWTSIPNSSNPSRNKQSAYSAQSLDNSAKLSPGPQNDRLALDFIDNNIDLESFIRKPILQIKTQPVAGVDAENRSDIPIK
jgi:hypothetical protein